MTNPNMPPDMPSASAPPDDAGLPCVLVFNANDPSGAAGLSADILSVASVGGHALPVSTGAYVRDTTRIFDFFALEEEAVTEQARAILEDAPAQVIKVGFAGSPENVSAIAELAADYAEIPLVTCMPDLSWWEESRIDSYQDAVRELLLPQTTVLVGNHSTLCRWLVPDWHADRPPSARDSSDVDMGSQVSQSSRVPGVQPPRSPHPTPPRPTPLSPRTASGRDVQTTVLGNGV